MDVAQRVERWPNRQELLTCGHLLFTCVISRKIVSLGSMPWWLAYLTLVLSTFTRLTQQSALKVYFISPRFFLPVCNPSGRHVESVSKTLQTHPFLSTTVAPSSVPWTTQWAALVPSLPSSNLFSTQHPEIQFLFL